MLTVNLVFVMLIRRSYNVLALMPLAFVLLAVVLMLSQYVSVYMLMVVGVFVGTVYLHWRVFKWLVRKAIE